MEQITLGDIGAWLGYLAALIGSCGVIVVAIKKIIGNLFRAQTAELKTALTRIDVESTKNFLVNVLSAAERGEDMTEIQKIRVREQYDHYIAAGGNSYIKDWYTRLKTEGKI